MEEKLLKELKINGLAKYKFKKNYTNLQKIKKNILTKYQHELDWIEIENIGTKYIVRYEPRIENKKKDSLPFRNIIAKKNAIIHSLNISDGEIIKTKSNYVHKGEVIVSGYIHLYDKIVKTVTAQGKVLGEVWYTLNIDYPINYHNEMRINSHKTVYAFSVLNKQIELFNFHKYKTKEIKRKTILKNNILPIKFEKQIQYETKIIDKTYTKEEALKQSIKEGKKKLKHKVIDYQVLNTKLVDNTLKSKIFYTVIEDVTAYQNIKEYKDENNN